MSTEAKTTKLLKKQDLIKRLMESSGLTKSQVSDLLDTYREIIVTELKENGAITIPGVLKLRVINKPATTERNILSPATRQPMVVKAKPPRSILKSFPLKVLRDAVLPTTQSATSPATPETAANTPTT